MYARLLPLPLVACVSWAVAAQEPKTDGAAKPWPIGEFVARLVYDISDRGRIENCRVEQPSGLEGMDEKSCKILEERAGATLGWKDGRPIGAKDRKIIIRWRIEDR